jgi:hypothetical protein
MSHTVSDLQPIGFARVPWLRPSSVDEDARAELRVGGEELATGRPAGAHPIEAA